MEPGNENNEAGFVIDGTTYPVPALDTFNMDETVVLYEYCGLTLEDFAPVEEEDKTEDYEAEHRKKLAHPGFLKALLHIAYARGNPEFKPARVKLVVGRASFVESVEQLLEVTEESEDQLPPVEEPTSEPAQSSQRSSDGSSESSGEPSSLALVAQGETPPSTGTTS